MLAMPMIFRHHLAFASFLPFLQRQRFPYFSGALNSTHLRSEQYSVLAPAKACKYHLPTNDYLLGVHAETRDVQRTYDIFFGK